MVDKKRTYFAKLEFRELGGKLKCGTTRGVFSVTLLQHARTYKNMKLRNEHWVKEIGQEERFQIHGLLRSLLGQW